MLRSIEPTIGQGLDRITIHVNSNTIKKWQSKWHWCGWYQMRTGSNITVSDDFAHAGVWFNEVWIKGKV